MPSISEREELLRLVTDKIHRGTLFPLSTQRCWAGPQPDLRREYEFAASRRGWEHRTSHSGSVGVSSTRLRSLGPSLLGDPTGTKGKGDTLP
jgi:hypothetical protein